MNNYDDYLYSINQINSINPIPNFELNARKEEWLEPYTGFLMGNLSKSLYDGYKNHKPMEINPSNEKDYDLLMVQVYDFATHDLDLYLDNHPNDNEVIRLREECFNNCKRAKALYESKYGALDKSSSVLSKTPWNWCNKNWPWEREDNV